MIKKVKIVAIHPKDNFYPYREQILGRTVELDISEEQYIEGWTSTNANRNVHKSKWAGIEFLAILVEDAE